MRSESNRSIDRNEFSFFLSFPPLQSLNSRYRNLGRSVYTGVSGASIFHARLAWMPPFTRRRREGGGGGGGRRRSHSFTATSTTGQAFTIKSRFLRQQGFNARHSLRGLRYVCTTSTGLETLSPRQMVRDSPFQTITVTEFPATTTTDDEAPNLCRYANKWHRSGRVQKTHNAIRALRAIVSQSNHDRAFTSHRLDGRVAPGQTPPPLTPITIFRGKAVSYSPRHAPTYASRIPTPVTPITQPRPCGWRLYERVVRPSSSFALIARRSYRYSLSRSFLLHPFPPPQ